MSLRTVNSWIQSGQLEIVKIGQTVRIEESELAAFFERNRQRNVPRDPVGEAIQEITDRAAGPNQMMAETERWEPDWLTAENARLERLERESEQRQWIPEHSPRGSVDYLIAVLAWVLAAHGWACARPDLGALPAISPEDLAAGPRVLAELVGIARSEDPTLDRSQARQLLSRVGFPDPAALDIERAVFVALDDLRACRRIMLADEVARSTSARHRRAAIERLALLEEIAS